MSELYLNKYIRLHIYDAHSAQSKTARKGLSYFDDSKRVSHHISCVYQVILKTLHDPDRSCKENARLKLVT